MYNSLREIVPDCSGLKWQRSLSVLFVFFVVVVLNEGIVNGLVSEAE